MTDIVEHKLRNLLSHATGGRVKDISLTDNQMAVEVTRFRNELWEQAQASASDQIEQLRKDKAALVEELQLWRSLVEEGGVPRYTVVPDTIVTSTDALLKRQALRAHEHTTGETS